MKLDDSVDVSSLDLAVRIAYSAVERTVYLNLEVHSLVEVAVHYSLYSSDSVRTAKRRGKKRVL